jgi:hypothetical protein
MKDNNIKYDGNNINKMKQMKNGIHLRMLGKKQINNEII